MIHVYLHCCNLSLLCSLVCLKFTDLFFTDNLFLKMAVSLPVNVNKLFLHFKSCLTTSLPSEQFSTTCYIYEFYSTELWVWIERPPNSENTKTMIRKHYNPENCWEKCSHYYCSIVVQFKISPHVWLNPFQRVLGREVEGGGGNLLSLIIVEMEITDMQVICQCLAFQGKHSQ